MRERNWRNAAYIHMKTANAPSALQKERGERKKWEYNRGGELVLGMLHACVELLQ
jgi:hypothetical protein